jgi:hypothetical protein
VPNCDHFYVGREQQVIEIVVCERRSHLR